MVKCPKDGSAYVKGKCDYEQFGIIIRNINCLRCPKCGDELFTPEQVRIIRERIGALAPEVRLIRRISKAGKRPALYLPKDIVSRLKLSIGQEVSIYLEGKKRIVIEPITA